MNTPVIDTADSDSAADHRDRRRPWMLGVAAAVVLAFAGAAVVASIGGGADPTDVADPIDSETPPMELSLGDGATMASCLPFDVTFLAGMSPAFAGTATAVDDGTATLSVDRWYAGGDNDTVVLQSPNSSPALIAGFEFAVGERYLITAAEGNVNFCGYSGPATQELTAAFDAAFGG